MSSSVRARLIALVSERQMSIGWAGAVNAICVGMNDWSYGHAGVAVQMAAKRDAASGESAYDAMAVAAKQLGRSLTGGGRCPYGERGAEVFGETRNEPILARRRPCFASSGQRMPGHETAASRSQA